MEKHLLNIYLIHSIHSFSQRGWERGARNDLILNCSPILKYTPKSSMSTWTAFVLVIKKSKRPEIWTGRESPNVESWFHLGEPKRLNNCTGRGESLWGTVTRTRTGVGMTSISIAEKSGPARAAWKLERKIHCSNLEPCKSQWLQLTLAVFTYLFIYKNNKSLFRRKCLNNIAIIP